MIRFAVPAALIVIGLFVFALVDLTLTDRSRVRTLPKVAWFFVLLVPVVGAALWLLFGKERGSRGGAPRTVAPDDDPTFLANLRRDEEQDERIRRLEQELAELDDDPPKD
jgi:hypothetical protein